MILLTAHITSATAETYLSLSIKTKNNNKNSQIKSASKRDQTALLLQHIEPEM